MNYYLVFLNACYLIFSVNHFMDLSQLSWDNPRMKKSKGLCNCYKYYSNYKLLYLSLKLVKLTDEWSSIVLLEEGIFFSSDYFDVMFSLHKTKFSILVSENSFSSWGGILCTFVDQMEIMGRNVNFQHH